MTRRRNRLPATIKLPSWWRRHLGPLLAALVIVLVVAIDRGGWAPRPQAPAVLPDSFNQDDKSRYHDREFPVVHVVDGDTLDIEAPDLGSGKAKTRIRLWGVDSPEIAHGGSGNMFFGPEATAFAKEKLSGHDVRVVLSPKRTRDRYGRLLAYVFLDSGEMFNELLIEEGFAYADPRFDHHYKSRFADTERRAKEKQAGLWAAIQTSDMPKWRQKREKKQTASELANDVDEHSP